MWGGIPTADEPADAESGGASMAGVYQFKVGFGGDLHDYPAVFEHRYRPIPAALIRQIQTGIRERPSLTARILRHHAPDA